MWYFEAVVFELIANSISGGRDNPHFDHKQLLPLHFVSGSF